MKNRDVTPVRVLIQGPDFKVENWSNDFEKFGDTLVPVRTGLYLPYDFFRFLVAYGLPDALIIRYLNDRSSLFGTLRLALGEWCGIAACLLLKGQVFWICHNVDRETKIFHPKLNELRRWVVSRFARRVFVTDPLLVPAVERFLPSINSSKVDWVTFGKYTFRECVDNDVSQEIRRFVGHFRAQAIRDNRIPLVGLCLGAPGEKFAHFEYARALLRSAEQTRFRVALIIAGDFSRDVPSLQQREFELLSEDPNVLFFNRYVCMDEHKVADLFDFFWRGYRDWSMSYTLYVAATVRKPVLALDMGFVAMAVRAYGLGATVDECFDGLNDALQEIQSWEPHGANEFLETHTWEAGAQRLRAAVSDV